jgi:hypothetical protein
VVSCSKLEEMINNIIVFNYLQRMKCLGITGGMRSTRLL